MYHLLLFAMSIRVLAPSLSYELLLDKGHEHDPTLYVWLSQDVSCSVKTVRQSGQAVEWEFDAKTATVPTQSASIPLVERLQYCNLNVDVFCRVKTKHGETAHNQAGSISIPMREILGGVSRKHRIIIPSWGDPNARGANRDPSVENNKGWLQLDGPVQVLLDNQPVSPLDAAQVAFAERVEASKEQVYRHYMSGLVAFCKKLGYTWQVTSLINAYV